MTRHRYIINVCMFQINACCFVDLNYTNILISFVTKQKHILFLVVFLCFVFCFVLFCFVLLCFALFCFVLFCFVLFCFVLFCFALLCFVLFCFVLFCLVLLGFALLCLRGFHVFLMSIKHIYVRYTKKGCLFKPSLSTQLWLASVSKYAPLNVQPSIFSL